MFWLLIFSSYSAFVTLTTLAQLFAIHPSGYKGSTPLIKYVKGSF